MLDIVPFPLPSEQPSAGSLNCNNVVGGVVKLFLSCTVLTADERSSQVTLQRNVCRLLGVELVQLGSSPLSVKSTPGDRLQRSHSFRHLCCAKCLLDLLPLPLRQTSPAGRLERGNVPSRALKSLLRCDPFVASEILSSLSLKPSGHDIEGPNEVTAMSVSLRNQSSPCGGLDADCPIVHEILLFPLGKQAPTVESASCSRLEAHDR